VITIDMDIKDGTMQLKPRVILSRKALERIVSEAAELPPEFWSPELLGENVIDFNFILDRRGGFLGVEVQCEREPSVQFDSRRGAVTAEHDGERVEASVDDDTAESITHSYQQIFEGRK